MTDDTTPSYAEALAEIRRLRSENEFLQRMHAKAVSVFGTERDSLYARITELEAASATMVGTLAKPTPHDDQPATYTHDVPPNAPPHNER